MELWKDLITSKVLASNQDSSKGKPAHSGSLYNLTVRLVLQRQLNNIIVELDKTEAKAIKLARAVYSKPLPDD